MVNVTSHEQDELGGYDLFPERKNGVKTFKDNLLGQNRPGERMRCEANVRKCINESAIVKLMLAALKSSGCEVDPKRHIVCEPCDPSVTGGYDFDTNQVVICQNNVSRWGLVQGVLSHELLHMFDRCRTKMDFKNPEHIACTEIRAASTMHCSFMSAFVQGLATPFDFEKAHERCVRHKAVQSLIAVKKISKDEAEKAVDKVFSVCYNDLEPVGRRLRRNSYDMDKAYQERYHHGYTDI